VAEVKRGHEILERVEMDLTLPNRFTINGDLDAKDIWIGTSKGLAWGIGDDYYAGLRERPLHPLYLANSQEAPALKAQATPKVRGAGAVARLKR
jgi:hypothetical protein